MKRLFTNFRSRTIIRKGGYDGSKPVVITYPPKGILKISTQEESLQQCKRQSNVENLSSHMKSLRGSLKQALTQTQVLNNSSHHHMCIQQKLRFGTIEIREYNLILGDNPQCSEGVALTLDWDYKIDEDIPTNVDDYEYYRLPRRKFKDLIIPADDREEILLRQGVTYDELNNAAEDLDKARLLRLQTINDFHVKSRGRGRKNLMSVQPWFHSSVRLFPCKNILFRSSRRVEI